MIPEFTTVKFAPASTFAIPAVPYAVSSEIAVALDAPSTRATTTLLSVALYPIM